MKKVIFFALVLILALLSACSNSHKQCAAYTKHQTGPSNYHQNQ